MTIIQLSPPRTRGTMLYTALEDYVRSQGLHLVKNYAELFNPRSRVVRVLTKDGDEHETEVYPYLDKTGISVSFVYPPIFKSAIERFEKKLDLLLVERVYGRDYFIKLSFGLAESNYDKVFEHFRGRKLILTDRKNKTDMVCSRFHQIYDSSLAYWTINPHAAVSYMEYMKRGYVMMEQAKKFFSDNITIWYEDVPTNRELHQKIREFLGDVPNLKNASTKETGIVYRDVVRNYDEIENLVNERFP